MSVETIRKSTKDRTSYNYKAWIDTVASKGLWEDYIGVEYINLVQVLEKQNNGTKSNYQIMDISLAKDLVAKHKNIYDFVEIDNEKLRQNDYFKYNPQSFFDKVRLRIKAIKHPTESPKKNIEPFTAYQKVMLFIALSALAFTVMSFMVALIVGFDKIEQFIGINN